MPYWKQFGIRPKKCWYMSDYKRLGTVDPRYIPADIFHRYVIPHFNNLRFTAQLKDKNLSHLLLPGVKQPETIFKYADGYYRENDLSPISKEEAVRRLSLPGHYVLKPARHSCSGNHISFLDADESTSPQDDILPLLERYQDIDYIVQRALVQHPDLAVFNPSSVNTIRLITLLFRGQAYLLNGILRIGHAGSRVDNVTKGGYQAIIQPDGSLEKLAYTHKGNVEKYVEQTDEGVRFEGAVIPSWERVRQTALDLALRMPHLGLLGWDFSVDEQGDPVVIEFNCHFGQNQENCGPTFGDMTDEVLAEVFRDKSLRL